MAEAQSRVELIVNAAKAINPLRKTQQETKKLDMAVQGVNKRTATATANIQRFGVSFRSVLGPVVAVTGAVTLLSRSLRVMGEREADVAVLRNGLRGLVGDAATATEQLQKTADVLGKQTLFNEEDFTKGFKLLTSFRTIGVDSYSRVATAAADVAQISGTDVRSAFMQLAKALDMPERNLTALTRAGILFSKEQTKQIVELKKSGKQFEAQAKILEIIEGQYEGAAAAAGKTFAGAVDTLQENFRDFQERLATGVAPALQKLLEGLTKVLEVVLKIPEPVGQAALAMGGLAASIALVKSAALGGAVAGLIQGLVTLGGVTAQTAVGFNAAGATIFATSTKVTALAVGAGLLKAAMIALPVAGLVAGFGFLIAKLIEAKTRQEKITKAIKEGGREALDAALNVAVLAQAQAAQRLANLEAQKKGVTPRLLAAREELRLQNENIRKIQDRLGLLAEENEKKRESLSQTEKVKDISQNQLDLELRKLQAQRQGDALEVAYLEKLIRREEIMQKEMGARERTLELLRTEIEYSERVKDIRQEIADIIAGAQITPGESTFDGNEAGGIFTGDASARTQHLEELKEKLKELLDPMEMVRKASEAIGNAFSNSIKGLVDGSLTAREALRGFFKSVADSFLQMATDIINAAIRMMAFNIIASLFPGVGSFSASSMTLPGLSGKGALARPGILPGIGGGGGAVPGYAGVTPFTGLAKGGTAMGGRSYIVGERGPELFTPGRTGSVTPNNAMGNVNVNVNVDATGSSVEGNDTQANQLGVAIAAAVKHELIIQKRPGGLLS